MPAWQKLLAPLTRLLTNEMHRFLTVFQRVHAALAMPSCNEHTSPVCTSSCRPVVIKRPHIVALMLVTLFLGLASQQASARGFTINNIDARLDDASILVDGDISVELTDDVRKALTKSIAVQLNVEFILSRERRYMWDKEIAIWTLPAVIYYKPVSDQYVVTRPDLVNEEESFHTQMEALKRAGVFYNLRLPLDEPLPDDDKNYIIETRITLDLSQLPAPMRPLAYFSSSWRLNSKWTAWPLKR